MYLIKCHAKQFIWVGFFLAYLTTPSLAYPNNSDDIQNLLDNYGQDKVVDVLKSLSGGEITIMHFGRVPRYERVAYNPFDLALRRANYTINRLTIGMDLAKLNLTPNDFEKKIRVYNSYLAKEKIKLQAQREASRQKYLEERPQRQQEAARRLRVEKARQQARMEAGQQLMQEARVESARQHKNNSNHLANKTNIPYLSVAISQIGSLLLGYFLFFLIARQKNPFIKPVEPSNRPRWFLGFGAGLCLYAAIFSPITGVLGEDIAGRLVLKTVMFCFYMLFVVIFYYIYKIKIKHKSATVRQLKNKLKELTVKNKSRAVLVIFVMISLISITVLVIYLSKPTNFDDCILDKMEGVGSDWAAKNINRSCRAKFPN